MSALVRSCKMENVKVIKVTESDGSPTEHVIIDRGNGEFTSMSKSVWDELEASKENGTIS
jgi:hypothetical protein